MRYMLSIALHFLTGKLTAQDAIYALSNRPAAVVSKGITWIVDPDFKV